MAELTREERRERHRERMTLYEEMKKDEKECREIDRRRRSPSDQVAELDRRLGVGLGARRERWRLFRQMTGSQGSFSTADKSLSPAWLDETQAAWKG